MSVLTCCTRGKIFRSSIRLLKHHPKEAGGEGGSVHCWHLQLNDAAAERLRGSNERGCAAGEGDILVLVHTVSCWGGGG